MHIEKVQGCEQKIGIATALLEGLPNWFGLPESTKEYITESSQMPFWAAREGEDYIGFIALKQHSDVAAEVYVMGIKETYHRKGIGKALIEECVEFCQQNAISFLQVKTVDASNSDIYYARTRAFYKSVGFKTLEVFPTLWDSANPCLMMIQYIG